MVRIAGINPFGRGRILRAGVSLAQPIDTADELPAEVDVAVVGGGLAGVTTAIHLEEQGLRVLVLEKGLVAAEQSSRALGWVSSLGDRGGRLILSTAGKELWTGYGSRLGVETTFRRVGLSIVCQSDEEASLFEKWVADNPADASLVAPEKLAQASIGANLPGAQVVVRQASDAGVEPEQATTALAAGAIKRGVSIVQNCAVRGLETTGGAVSSVVTERGTVRCHAVVVAAGAWSRLFCRSVGVTIPQLPSYATVSRTGVAADGPQGCGGATRLGWRRRADGGYSFGSATAVAPIIPDSFRFALRFLPALVQRSKAMSLDLSGDFVDALRTPRQWALDEASPFEKNRILSIMPDDADANSGLERLRSLGRALSELPIEQSWASVIDNTPDATPIVSAVSGLQGLFLNTGHSGHGLAMAPAAGQLVAQLVAGTSPSVDPAPFALSRFG